jgi:2-oxoacid:acceptor oxidoreductase delta subunit (pyruvate/2-ketoisovalerate family)
MAEIKKRSAQAKTYSIRSWREFPEKNASLGTMLHNRTGSWRFIKPVYVDKVPACQNACPAGNDIEAWIKLVQEKKYEEAYWHLKREEPFPAILGRVCYRFCEDACNRGPFDECIAINALERFVADQVDTSRPHPDLPAEDNGATLAIVGSGPAGMTAAYFARLMGYRVTIFEALPEPGGILRVGIPAYRLPREVVAREFEALEAMGVEIRCNTPVGKDVTLEQLRREHDYVFLATGVHRSRPLGLAGEDESPRVMSGLQMLRRVALGETPELGERVVVVGGGNTAIDAARTAVRLGCEVTVLYRRTEKEMPAHAEEVAEAREEGVTFHFLAIPEKLELNDDDDTVKRLLCCEMELGAPDESGRRRPVKKDGATFELPADSIISAIGEQPVFDYLQESVETVWDTVKVDEWLRANGGDKDAAAVYAGGDIIDIPHTVIHAVAAGKKAALAMDCARQGLVYEELFPRIAIGSAGGVSFAKYMGWQPLNPVRQDLHEVVGSERINYDYFEEAARQEFPVADADRRKESFEPYRQTMTEAEALAEAERCLHCGRCIECDNCLIFCPDTAVLAQRNNTFGYVFDYDYCKGCGVCANECPRDAIRMVPEETNIEEE